MRVLVTGGSSDIARAIIAHLSAHGHECFFTSSGEKTHKQNLDFYSENSIDAKGVLYNFNDQNQLEENNFDVLILNAAGKMPRNKKLHELTNEELQKYISTEIFGNINLAKQIIPSMMEKKFGRIIFISSMSTKLATSKYSSYIMVKNSLEGLINNIAVDYAKENILANTLRLGLFKTSRLKFLWKRDAYQEMVKDVVMQGRMGEPKDVLKAIDLLIDESLYMTGSSIDLAGGLPILNSSRD